MTENPKGLQEYRVVTCHRCEKTIDKENDSFATRLVIDEHERKFRLYYCGGCIIMGKFP